MSEHSDFHGSAKIVLNLVKADLALGRENAEPIRMALVEAARCGMRRALISEGLVPQNLEANHFGSLKGVPDPVL